MGFLARGEEQDGEQSEALARIEAGGIPQRAEERLKALGTAIVSTDGAAKIEPPITVLDLNDQRP